MAESATPGEASPAAQADGAAPVRRITSADLRASLAEGLADFRENRGDLIFVGLLYPLVGIVVGIFFAGGRNLPLLFPLFAALSLLGPLVATGFYELARRREAGLESQWYHFFDVLKSPSIVSIAAVGVGLLGICAAWLAAAAIVYASFFGPGSPVAVDAFLTEIVTTQRGWMMMLVGNLVGLAFAVIVLAVSVVSLPMLVDRRGNAERAVATSLAAFRANPGVLLRWGLIVAVILVIAAIPLLIGLAVALPVLGYATWHLYTRLVDREAI
ncbi:MAG: DUF2189 domain-containing protein [Sphingomonadaceae bacterium]|nr:DUF2189 domain-containing protein [Sphingomonadaceae bacterium]